MPSLPHHRPMSSLSLFALVIGLLLAAYACLDLSGVLSAVLGVASLPVGLWALVVNHNEHIRRR